MISIVFLLDAHFQLTRRLKPVEKLRCCRMHDFDNNTKLDGLEILKALTHILPYQEDEGEKIDVRGKSADEIAKERKEKELLYYAGDDCMH